MPNKFQIHVYNFIIAPRAYFKIIKEPYTIARLLQSTIMLLGTVTISKQNKNDKSPFSMHFQIIQ